MDVYIHIHVHMHINDLHETNVQTIFFFHCCFVTNLSFLTWLLWVGGGVGRGLVLHAKMLLGGRDHYNCCIEYGVLNVL